MKGKFKSRLENAAAISRERQTKACALANIPQRKIPPVEIALYAVLPLALVMAGAMPSTGIVFMPVALCFCYLLYRRFGVLPPLFIIAFYGLFALAFNYDVLSVAYFVFLFVAFCGLVLSAQHKPYLLAAAIAAVVAVTGAALGVCTVRLAEGRPVSEIAARYIKEERDDPVIGFIAEIEYDGATDLGDGKKPTKGDEGYGDACIEYFSEYAKREARYYTVYNCIHFGAVIGVIGFLFAAALNRRTQSCADDDAAAEKLKDSTRALGGAVKLCAIKDMSVPRAYLWTCLLPAFVVTIVLSMIGGFDPITATVTHTFITLPSAFAFVTLMFFFASQAVGKGKIAANIILAVALIATAVFPIVLFVFSAAGICDVILNLRFWTTFLRDEL